MTNGRVTVLPPRVPPPPSYLVFTGTDSEHMEPLWAEAPAQFDEEVEDFLSHDWPFIKGTVDNVRSSDGS